MYFKRGSEYQFKFKSKCILITCHLQNSIRASLHNFHSATKSKPILPLPVAEHRRRIGADIDVWHELVALMDNLKHDDGGLYWQIEQKERIVRKVIGTEFDREAYERARLYESQSDRMFGAPPSIREFERNIVEEERIPFSVQSLNLATFLQAHNFSPVIVQEIIESKFSDKGFVIKFDGCENILQGNLDDQLKLHLQQDLLNILRHVDIINMSFQLRGKFHEILSGLPKSERKKHYVTATTHFKKMMDEFFPNEKPFTDSDKRIMERLQKEKAAHLKNGPKETPKRSLFWNICKEEQLEGLEKRYKPDDEEPENPQAGAGVH